MEGLFGREIPQPLLEIIDKGKQQDPEKRFQSCEEMLARLYWAGGRKEVVALCRK